MEEIEANEDGYVVVAAWLTVVEWVGGFRFLEKTVGRGCRGFRNSVGWDVGVLEERE